MTRKQVQSLITAGVFSASLLTGLAYADEMKGTDNGAAPAVTSESSQSATAAPVAKPHHKHKKSMMKNMPEHSCKGQNDCKGQGGCKGSDAGCKGQNSCKGKGGCATDGSKK